MPETKKLLVMFDPATPDAQSSDFLIPWSREGQAVFLRLKSGREHKNGMMVFVGRLISEKDLFAKLVDSGAFVSSVEETLDNLRNYIDQLQALKVGNVVRIATESGEATFRLELVANSPSGALGK